MYKKGKRFLEHVDEENKKTPGNIFNPPTTPQEGLHFLRDYLLGEDWYVTDPIGRDQINTQIVHEILMKHSRKYRKEYRKWRKN